MRWKYFYFLTFVYWNDIFFLLLLLLFFVFTKYHCHSIFSHSLSHLLHDSSRKTFIFRQLRNKCGAWTTK
jgi:hypothetical protein